MGPSKLVRFLAAWAAVGAGVGCSCGPGAPEPNVTVAATAYLDGGPDVGLTVFVNDADGGVKGTAATDDGGTARVYVPAGGSVTLARPAVTFSTGAGSATRGPSLETWTGVQPGDVLHSGVTRAAENSPSGRSIVVTLPGAVAGATSYQVMTGCASTTAATADPIMLALRSTCGGTVDVVAVARGSTGNLLSNASATNVALSGATTAVTLGAWGYLGALKVAFDNSLADAVTVTTRLTPSLHGLAFPAGQSGPTPVAASTFNNFYLSFPAAVTGPLLVEVDAAAPAGNATLLHKWPSPVVDAYDVRTADFLAFPQLTSTSPEDLRWTLESGRPDPDVQVVALQYASASAGNVLWTAVVPPGSTSASFPELPEALAGWALTPTVTFGPLVQEVESTSWAGFADARQQWFRDPGGRSGDDFTVRMTEAH